MATNSNGKASGKSEGPPDWYINSRKKDTSTAGTLTFTTLRLLDLPWQYYFLSSTLGPRLLTRIGLMPLRSATPPSSLALGGSPYHKLIAGLACGTSLSQICWVWGVRDNYFPPSGATFVAAYNSLLNTLNSALAIWAVTSQEPPIYGTLLSSSWAVKFGVPLYLLGLYVERYSEVQRKAFKAKSVNTGKPYSGGLFSLARNINYGGYTLMRTGYALVCGGWVWGAIMGGMVAGDFAFRAIPWLEEYCENRVCSSHIELYSAYDVADTDA